jgi:hypothetical protein
MDFLSATKQSIIERHVELTPVKKGLMTALVKTLKVDGNFLSFLTLIPKDILSAYVNRIKGKDLSSDFNACLACLGLLSNKKEFNQTNPDEILNDLVDKGKTLAASFLMMLDLEDIRRKGFIEMKLSGKEWDLDNCKFKPIFSSKDILMELSLCDSRLTELQSKVLFSLYPFDALKKDSLAFMDNVIQELRKTMADNSKQAVSAD